MNFAAFAAVIHTYTIQCTYTLHVHSGNAVQLFSDVHEKIRGNFPISIPSFSPFPSLVPFPFLLFLHLPVLDDFVGFKFSPVTLTFSFIDKGKGKHTCIAPLMKLHLKALRVAPANYTIPSSTLRTFDRWRHLNDRHLIPARYSFIDLG